MAARSFPSWIITQEPGMVPNRKGPFHDDKYVEQMLRDAYRSSPDIICIVIESPLETGWYPQHGYEWLDIYGDRRRRHPRKDRISTPRKEDKTDAVKPVAAYTVDLTGCEHLSRDVAGIERIAAAGATGPTQVIYLYDAPPASISADAVVEACADRIWPIVLEKLRSDPKVSAHVSGWLADYIYGAITHAIRALKGTFSAAPEAKSEVAGWATPLEWNTAWGPDPDGDVCFTAGTPFGSFNVERLNGSWRWRYCFDEYYDEESFECEDEADGKQKAQEHWNGRLAPFIRSALVDPEGGV